MIGNEAEQLVVEHFEKLGAFLPRGGAQPGGEGFFDLEVMPQRCQAAS